MFDAIPFPKTTPTDTTAIPPIDWTTALAVGDIVSYRFPVAEEDGSAAPKARPCLVLDVETVGDARYALLAYGTSARSAANRGYEIQVRGIDTVRAAGLHRPTRFVGARRLLVPLDATGFVICAALGTPLLGRLAGNPRERMNVVRARIHAERDIAADRRASRRRPPRRSRAPRPFLVEHRHPRRAARPQVGL